jgi:hypothetical protein
MAKITRKNVTKELAGQGVDEAGLPDEEALDALAQTATGLLAASAGAPGIPQEKIREQIVAHVVFAYLRRPDPRDVHASMIPKLVMESFKQKEASKPSKVVVETLAKVATGFLRESENTFPAAAKLIAVRSVVDFYLTGA